MIRSVVLVVLGLVTACSEQPSTARHDATATPPPALPTPTADMLAAKQVAQRYFDSLRSGDYAGALALWSDDAATVTGGIKAFAAASRAQGRFEGRAGDPTAVRESGALRYVLVESSARVVSPSGKVSDQSGVVMLKRSARDAGGWRIWGTDIRPRRCKTGQVARGLGCVQA